MFKQFMSFFREEKRKIPLLLIGGLVSAFTSVFMSYTMQNAVDAIFSPSQLRILLSIAIFIAMSILVFFSDQIIEGIWVSRHAMQVEKRLRIRLQRTYFKSDYQTVSKNNLGHLMNLDDMISDLVETYTTVFFTLPYGILESVFFLIYLICFIHWKMVFVILLLIPMAFVTRFISQRIGKLNRKIIDTKSQSNTLFFDSLTKLDFVMANGLMAPLSRLYRDKKKTILKVQDRVYQNNTVLSLFQFVIEQGIKLVVPIYGMILMSQNEMTPGGVAVSTTIFTSFLVPSISQLLRIYKDLKASAPMIQELSDQMSLPEQSNQSKALAVSSLPKDVLIDLQDICFQYASSARPVIQHLSLQLPVTGSVGICGLSGEGKSTLARLIANLFLPQEGRITYNSQYFDSIGSLRDGIAYMTPEYFFMQDTIYENLSCGGEDAAYAADLLQLNSFVGKWPDDYDTQVEENGKNFSGGQKQLLSLARCFAKKSSIVILDEPTSSLDHSAEQQVIKAIQTLSKEKCVLVISHQLDVLMAADTQYIFEEKKLKQLNSKKDAIAQLEAVLERRKANA